MCRRETTVDVDSDVNGQDYEGMGRKVPQIDL